MYSWLLVVVGAIVQAAVIPMSEHAVVELSIAGAVDVQASDVTPRSAQTVTTLSPTQLSALSPYTQFARAAYCPSSKVTNWNCGEACKANAGFQVTLTGGDGNGVPLFFVGYWPAQKSVVVAHEGTDPTQFLSLLTDADIIQRRLDSALFTGVPDSVRIHDGFADAQETTATAILAETKRLLAAKNATTVTSVGHSLGGALAELDALFLTVNLPSNIHVKAVTYGTPRVGNPAWAPYFDSMVPDFVRVNNERDIIPIVPGRSLGYAHPHGEIHIRSPGNAVACSGDDNATDGVCTISTVPNIFVGNLLDHLGPYEGISIGTIFCT